ncbi:MAG: hypothetical protein O8C67_06175, partial [Candidatus Methanoperedens sp.]|nr:hypothetical protein [Candidatus Methanoperedens sp.]
MVRTNTSLETTTNASGFYNFSLINSTYTINASKIGYDANATTVTVNGRNLTNVNISLVYHPYKLSGYILNKSSGLPLSGVTIKVANTYLNMTTGADGFYNFTLIDGEHSVVAILQNYAINFTTVTVNGANISNANISLIPTVSQGRDAWHSAGYSLPLPYSASWIPAILAQKNAILYNDSNIWETKLTTGHDQFDDQLYRFNVMQPSNEVKNLTVKWIGHGENKPGYDTYLYIWNYNSVSWELLDTKNLGVEGTLNRSITINPGNYIDLYGFVYIAARARHYDYAPGTPSWISLDGTYADEPITCSWGPVIDLDGDLVQYFADINGYNSGWINDTSFTNTALYEGNTCSVKTRDNYTYTESSSVSAYAWIDYYYSLNTNYVELKVNNQLTGNNIFNVSSTATFSSSSISWNNDVTSDNRVYYGLNETEVNNIVNGSWSVWNNNSINPVIRLTGLMSNTTYYYRPLTWYSGTVNNSVKAMALTTAKPGVWVSPAEYMVSPAGWISSPSNFRTINISAAPLSGNGRYIPGLSLEAVIYNNSGFEIGRINLTGNGPYYANFNLPDYFTDEGGYVTITNYSITGEFSVLKWSCLNCHNAGAENYPSTFEPGTVHPGHFDTTNINVQHEGESFTSTTQCMDCHEPRYPNWLMHPSAGVCGDCHKSPSGSGITAALACENCHNDRTTNQSVLSPLYGVDKHTTLNCSNCHGPLTSVTTKPNCTTCHPRPGSNLTSVPGSIENKSHSNNQTVACGQCHNREHDVKALTTAASECKNCHTGITHDRGTQCTTCHGIDPHTVSDGSGPGCLDCHNTSSLHRFENDGLSIYYLDGANFSLSVHANLNSNNASGYGINASCWACHGNGTKPTQHPANYKKPFYCADCHTPSGSQSSKYNAPLVYKHYPGSLFTGSIMYDATDTNRTCVSCHNNSKVITQNLSYGTYDAGKVKNASVSHYSAN